MKVKKLIKLALCSDDWIDVKNQLPDERQMVTVYGIPSGTKTQKVWGGVVFSNGDFYDFDIVFSHPKIGNVAEFVKMEGVTHWMPLPPPPSL